MSNVQISQLTLSISDKKLDAYLQKNIYGGAYFSFSFSYSQNSNTVEQKDIIVGDGAVVQNGSNSINTNYNYYTTPAA